jgi:hypothetical protein
MIFRLRNSKLASKLLSYRNLKTTGALKGGAAVTPSSGSSNGGLLDTIKAAILIPAHPKEHQGYVYREAANLQGNVHATLAKITLSIAWAFIFYNLYHHPENLFGHAPYPDTAKWTDKELGIPADDEE